MKKKELSFEIAHIKFNYVYSSCINISDDATIHNFIIQSEDDFDVMNSIEVCGSIEDECKTDEIPVFKAPAWSMYNSYIIFHPNGQNIAKMLLLEGYSKVKTLIKDLSFSTHPLPICITGFLLQRKLMEKKKGFIMHGAVIQAGQDAFALTGNSGVGKSTLSDIISKNIDCERISDDRYIIRNDDNKYVAYGNPFDTKAERNLNKGVEIKKMFFLHHDLSNHHEEVAKGELMRKLLTVSMLPYWEGSYLGWSLGLLHEMVSRIKIYNLYFKPDAEVVGYLLNNGLISIAE